MFDYVISLQIYIKFFFCLEFYIPIEIFHSFGYVIVISVDRKKLAIELLKCIKGVDCKSLFFNDFHFHILLSKFKCEIFETQIVFTATLLTNYHSDS